MTRVGGVGVGVFSRDVEALGLVLSEFNVFLNELRSVLNAPRYQTATTPTS
jgi:hypothetical protein